MNSDIPRSRLADVALRQRAEATGLALQHSIDALLGQLARAGARDQKGLQAVLKLSQSAVSRLMTSTRSSDPLATLFAIPGQEALRQMLKGAAQHGASSDAIARVDEAISGFERFIDVDMGDRATLEAVLSDWAQESRATFELRHKTAAFKSVSALRGVQAQLVLNTGILYPSATNADFHDCVGIDALLGCRRTRPSGVLRVCSSSMVAEGSRFIASGINGQPVHTMADMLLPQFSTISTDEIEVASHGHIVETAVSGLPLGRADGHGGDLVFGQLYRNLHRARRGAGGPTAGLGGQAEPPSEVYIVDALLHDDVWPGVAPEVRLYDTVVRGIAHPDDPARTGDRLDMLESVQSLGRGPSALRMPEFPQYPELIRHACETLGWDVNKLRGYRCKVRYPIYGSQIGLSFTLPV
ncbi:MAG TPA: hypothetical protein VLA61_11125 [Ideonella sp.]|uniref:hypothetical protein n=1 Tax=Ideonella sp. TaxID=1929293 RepID=UPI002BEB5FF7|nr:hypothetical protein [Ideonella sp.]HSI48815.1 hypothetical protein [Ideonella sp.]